MPDRRPRIIHLVHDTPGRTRLRLGWLRDNPEAAEPLAEHLAGLDASMEVQVRPWTGSVLCSYDPERLDAKQIVAATRRHTGIAILQKRGESHPEAEAEYARALRAGVGSMRVSLTDAFRGINQDVLRATNGRLDLGALTGLSFLGMGALEILGTREAPVPPWFNLAWWGYRTFTVSGEHAEREGGEPEHSEAAEESSPPDVEDLAPADA